MGFKFIAEIVEAEGIASLLVKLEVVPLGLLVFRLLVDNFHHPFKAAKPGGDFRLQVNQDAVVVGGITFGSNRHW